MVSRSTERRRRLGLRTVTVDLEESEWQELFAATGMTTKRAVVEACLRQTVEAQKARMQARSD
ncbi:type II toxin-antitoxin system VapB family antitoxin [Sphingomonas dokdonensis]|uniref:Ribbon-helix-helix protein CopG domain-containing protein n=1 Tax=Sphingomonas dokdonensis TaxID=344880 RepID=A0A245ZU22_9SPHN|nr:hypothetical protein SPDO_01220 [Sphingomonas dokdonensis]